MPAAPAIEVFRNVRRELPLVAIRLSSLYVLPTLLRIPDF
jgi:hypothetical protein